MKGRKDEGNGEERSWWELPNARFFFKCYLFLLLLCALYLLSRCMLPFTQSYIQTKDMLLMSEELSSVA